MHIESLHVRGLRSLADSKLSDCGSFNVLIGKNNSGKSNLLTAIDVLFKVLNVGSPATYRSPLDPTVDHYGGERQEEILLSARFNLGEVETGKLLSWITEEFPQVSQALTELRPFEALEVDLSFRSLPRPIAVVSRLSLASGNASRDLLRVSISAAADIATREADIAKFSEASEAIRQASGRVIETHRQLREGKLPKAYYIREFGQLPDDLATRVGQILDQNESGEEAAQSLVGFGLELQRRAEEAETRKNTEPIQTFAGEALTVPKYVYKVLESLAGSKILHLADRRLPIGEAEASRLLALKTRRGGGQLLSTIQNTVSSLLGVTIDAYTKSDDPPPYPTSLRGRRPQPQSEAELDVDDFLVQVNGSGIKEALRLLLDVEFEHPDILLVEEPEVHLHPALEISVMRYLRELSKTCQVFLTTHSTNFIDTGGVQTVHLVKKAEATNVEHLDLRDIEVEVPRELGLRLSSVFMFERLLFVEGVSDELIIRSIASTAGVNLGQLNVGFVIMEGARNFSHYASSATLSLLSHRQVHSVFLIDRDERSEADIAALERTLGSAGELHVLARREIENYLLAPRAVALLLRERSSGSVALSPDAVAEALDSVADELRETSVAKRVAASICRPVFPDRIAFNKGWTDSGVEEASREVVAQSIEKLTGLSGRIGEIVQRATEDVSKHWERGEKLHAAPGHEILDGVFRRHGLRFKKESDSVRLAELLKPSEIDAEIVAMLNGLSSECNGQEVRSTY